MKNFKNVKRDYSRIKKIGEGIGALIYTTYLAHLIVVTVLG